MTHLLSTYGLVLVFLVVALETVGIPLPGETALVAAAVLAQQGHFSIVWVIVVAAAGAIVGGSAGYWLGYRGGRKLLERIPILHRHAERVLPSAERFFERHGPAAVFFARFAAFLRIFAAWIAGISRMPWWQFFAWNAFAAVIWATAIGLLAYELGHVVERYGLYAGIAIGVVVVGAFFAARLWQRRSLERR